MLIAVAGGGNLSRYIVEEFPKAGHEVIVLTRGPKSFLEKTKVRQFITDYSPASLDKALEGCEALIVAIVDLTAGYIDVHLKLLEACQRSKTCRRLIPAEFAGNIRDYPDQPAYFANINTRVREALRNQTQVEWTLVCIGFFADYVVPSRNRYIMDMREGNIIDFEKKEILVPGSPEDVISMTSARDVARALAALVQADRWDEYTFLSRVQVTWQHIIDMLQERVPGFSVRVKTLDKILDFLAPGKSAEEIFFAQLLLYSASGAAKCPQELVQEQQRRFFSTLQFRSLAELWDLVEEQPNVIV